LGEAMAFFVEAHRPELFGKKAGIADPATLSGHPF